MKVALPSHSLLSRTVRTTFIPVVFYDAEGRALSWTLLEERSSIVDVSDEARFMAIFCLDYDGRRKAYVYELPLLKFVGSATEGSPSSLKSYGGDIDKHVASWLSRDFWSSLGQLPYTSPAR